jgi:hypothetical protein
LRHSTGFGSCKNCRCHDFSVRSLCPHPRSVALGDCGKRDAANAVAKEAAGRDALAIALFDIGGVRSRWAAKWSAPQISAFAEILEKSIAPYDWLWSNEFYHRLADALRAFLVPQQKADYPDLVHYLASEDENETQRGNDLAAILDMPIAGPFVARWEGGKRPTLFLRVTGALLRLGGGGKPQRIMESSRAPSRAVRTMGAIFVRVDGGQQWKFPVRSRLNQKTLRIASWLWVVLYKLHIRGEPFPGQRPILAGEQTATTSRLAPGERLSPPNWASEVTEPSVKIVENRIVISGQAIMTTTPIPKARPKSAATSIILFFNGSSRSVSAGAFLTVHA